MRAILLRQNLKAEEKTNKLLNLENICSSEILKSYLRSKLQLKFLNLSGGVSHRVTHRPIKNSNSA